MNVFIKSIRKLMGWCPNAKINETGSRISPDNFESYDRSGGEKADRSGGKRASSNFNRMKRIGLLLTSIGAFVSALSLVLDSKSTISSLMVGVGAISFLIGTILFIRS
jgi:hypothetical protein